MYKSVQESMFAFRTTLQQQGEGRKKKKKKKEFATFCGDIEV